MMKMMASSLAAVKKFCILAAQDALMMFTNAITKMITRAKIFRAHSPNASDAPVGRALTKIENNNSV